MIKQTSDNTTSALAAWYDISTSFADGVMQHFVGPEYDRGLDTVQAVYEAYPEEKAHIEYALSTNVRGRELATRLAIAGIGLTPGSNYLDIGCAYGGFLHAFKALGLNVLGVEIDPTVAKLADLNLSSTGSKLSIKVGDILTDDTNLINGTRFDLITCNDVIEHVADPFHCLQKIYEYLKPGGVAYVETVNKRSAINVAKDIHFGHFGITLLDHHSASAAYKQVSGWHEYQVSDFFVLEWYLSKAKQLGGDVDVVGGNSSDYNAEQATRLLFESHAEWKATAFIKLDPFLQYEIEHRLFSYCADFFSARQIAHETGNLSNFIQTWVDPVVRFTIRKAD
ncbi:class I SAM-dependent methyltransferase [Ochrobactrum sp. 3-3]|uniref:class I SAM-dependent methyltransferase n=1 Tax=Ochrobactrum sp. 3-3 TaxID=1830124 RepID=UPI000DEF0415|nr:class I SAM-dependent methyltransferase [Ochrobactrum sp. 3-3]